MGVNDIVQVSVGGQDPTPMPVAPYYAYDFLDKTIALCTLGALDSAALLASFFLEHELREAWWRPKQGEWVIDVGAGHGSYSLTALALGARVLAIEPDKHCLFDLLENAAVNGWSCHLQAIPALVGDGSYNATRSYCPTSHSQLRQEGQTEARRIITLDTLWRPPAGSGITCAWLKIDVEGEELEVLHGAKNLLTQEAPVVLVECHIGFVPGVDQEVSSYLVSLGYKEKDRRQGEGINDLWLLWGKDAG